MHRDIDASTKKIAPVRETRLGSTSAEKAQEKGSAAARVRANIPETNAGGGKETPAGEQFAAVPAEWTDVRFAPELDAATWSDAPPGPRLALIAGRTVDNPGFFRQALASGATHILLEKPGAPTVAELEAMAAEAKAAGVPVFMGFIKNIASYFTEALACANANPGSVVTLTSLNDYTAETLPECFERNAEGLLKNMAIHELALLVTFFGVNADTLGGVVADAAYSSCETRTGPSSGKEFTDFSRIGFTVTTTDGANVSVYADRCGLELPDGAMADGGMMYSSVSKLGIVQSRDIMPDAELEATVAARSAANPDWMPYFHLQHDDYITLKERCCAHVAAGSSGDPEGIATIQIGYDTLKLAETLKPMLEKQLL